MRSQSQYQRASMSNTFPLVYSFPKVYWSSYSEHASICYISQLSRVLSLGYIKVKNTLKHRKPNQLQWHVKTPLLETLYTVRERVKLRLGWRVGTRNRDSKVCGISQVLTSFLGLLCFIQIVILHTMSHNSSSEMLWGTIAPDSVDQVNSPGL